MSKETDKALEKLGKRIATLRKERGITQTALAYKIDWEKDNFRKIERGKQNITFDTLLKIAKALDISLSELLKDLE